MIRSVVLIAALASLPAFAAEPDPLLGRNLAASCAMCHGTGGRSVGITAPLAGRQAKDIVETVKLFREGKKPSTIMQQIAKGYTDAQIQAIAEYFADQEPAKKK